MELQAWKMANSMIRSWILNVIDPKLQTSITCVDTTIFMWENLRKHCVMCNTPKIHQLKAKIVECKQGGSEVVEFYSRLMGL